MKAGWDETARLKWNVELGFFGAKGNLMRGLQREGRTLVASSQELEEQLKLTSGGAGILETDSIDCFIVYALGFGLEPLLRYNARFRAASRLGTSAHEKVLPDNDFDAAVSHLVENAIAFRIVRMLRRMVEKPIWLVPQPYPLTAIRTRENPEWPFWSEVGLYAPALRWTLDEHATRFARRMDVGLLQQPQQTVADEYFTSPEYRRPWTHKRLPGLRRFYRTPDFTHMNSRFGAVLLDVLFGAARADLTRQD